VDEVAGVVDSLDHSKIGSGSVSPGSFPSRTSSGQLVEDQGEISLIKMQKLLIQFRTNEESSEWANAFQGVGQKAGMDIWRVESLHPIVVPKSEHVKFLFQRFLHSFADKFNNKWGSS